MFACDFVTQLCRGIVGELNQHPVCIGMEALWVTLQITDYSGN